MGERISVVLGYPLLKELTMMVQHLQRELKYKRDSLKILMEQGHQGRVTPVASDQLGAQWHRISYCSLIHLY